MKIKQAVSGKRNKNPIVVSSHDVHLDSDYVQWICDIKERFRNTQIKAAIKVNSEQLLFNQKEGLIPRSLLRNKLFQDMEEVIY